MAVSISQVYNSVKDIVNKEQKGFVTPTAFNSMASLAQIKIFNELMNEFVEARKISRQNLELTNSISFIRRKQEDLSSFIDEVVLNGANGDFIKPSNMVKLISVSDNGETDIDGANTDIEVVHDPELYSHIMRSFLSSPTEDYRVAFINGDSIRVRPVTNTVNLRYYRRPGSVLADGTFSNLDPQYSVSVIDGLQVQDANTRDFMLPSHYAPELVAEICEMIGVRLRDNSVQSFGAQKSAEQ